MHFKNDVMTTAPDIKRTEKMTDTKKKFPWVAVMVFAVCYLSYMCNYLLRQVYSTSQVIIVEQNLLTTA